MRYRRADTPGATCFFKLNAAGQLGRRLTAPTAARRDGLRTVCDQARVAVA